MTYELYFYPDEDDAVALLFSTQGAGSSGGWLCTSVVIEPPAVRTRYVTIPGRSGVLDYSDSLGPAYDDRKITFSLSASIAGANVQTLRRQVYNINGKSVRVTSPSTTQDKRIFPGANDTAGLWSFFGRCHLSSCVINGATLDAVITLDAFPVARSLNRTEQTLTIPRTSAAYVYRYQFPRPGVPQYPPFEITDAPLTLYPTENDAIADTNGLTLPVGSYDSHPYVWLNPEESTYQYVYACIKDDTATSATLTIRPYVYALV